MPSCSPKSPATWASLSRATLDPKPLLVLHSSESQSQSLRADAVPLLTRQQPLPLYRRLATQLLAQLLAHLRRAAAVRSHGLQLSSASRAYAHRSPCAHTDRHRASLEAVPALPCTSCVGGRSPSACTSEATSCKRVCGDGSSDDTVAPVACCGPEASPPPQSLGAEVHGCDPPPDGS